MGGSSGGGTTVQKSEPWEGAKPYLEQSMREAQRLYKGPGQKYYPGSTVVPFSNETNQELYRRTQRAQQGSAVNRAAQQNAQNTLNDKYLYNQPGSAQLEKIGGGAYLNSDPAASSFSLRTASRSILS